MNPRDLLAYRRDKDEVFRNHARSPIPEPQRSSFAGLAYFPPNPDLVFDLDVEPTDGEELRIPTSDGNERRYRRTGWVSFDVEGQRVTLTLLSGADEDGFFLPFRDVTSGNESYGAGRYLDLAPNENGQVHLDFNLAYNPYCAYNEAYSCPLPPSDNWLGVPIRAGEAAYHPT